MPLALSLEFSMPVTGDLFLVDRRVGTCKLGFRSRWCMEKGVVKVGTTLDLPPSQVAL